MDWGPGGDDETEGCEKHGPGLYGEVGGWVDEERSKPHACRDTQITYLRTCVLPGGISRCAQVLGVPFFHSSLSTHSPNTGPRKTEQRGMREAPSEAVEGLNAWDCWCGWEGG